MFVNQSLLQHLLTPVHYYGEDQLKTELQNLFVPGWHLAATTEDLSQSGDFVTLDLLGEPVLLYNPCLHQKTFGDLPAEESCDHELHESFTVFRTKWQDAMQSWVVRLLGLVPTNSYSHYHVHPNLVVTCNDSHRTAQLFLPTSANTTRHLVWVFGIRGQRNGPIAKLFAWEVSRRVKQLAYNVLQEDAHIFADIQRGVTASVHPGVIGRREERIYVFQDYVRRRCGETKKDGLDVTGHG